MGLFDNSSQTTQTVQSQAPGWQVPYQQYGLGQALAQFQGVNSPQQLVAGFSPLQNEALSNIQGYANSNPLGSAQNYVNSVLNGGPTTNPYLGQMFNQGANAVQNRLESEFAGSGRNIIGSAPVQSDSLNDLATKLYGGAFNTGVQQQENALASAPNIANGQMGLQQGLFGAGQQIQNLGQQYIQAPQTFLNQYLSQVTGNLGQTSAYSQPVTPFQQIGQAYMGAGLGQQIGSALGNYLGGSNGGSIGGLLGTAAGAFL